MMKIIYKIEKIWNNFGMNFQYSLYAIKLRLNGGMDYMTNGKTNNIHGFKFGTDWDIIDNLTISFNSMSEN